MGWNNKNNDCYINSFLQFLLQLNDFNKELIKIDDIITNNNTLLHQYCNILRLYFNLNIKE